MQASLPLFPQLAARLREGLETLPVDASGLVSLILALPRPPTVAPQLAGRQFQLEHPERGLLHGGYGVAAEWEAAGPGRLDQLARIARGLRGRWQRHDPDETGLDGFALLGFAASAEAVPVVEDQLPNALLWVPSVGLIVRDGVAALVFSATTPVPRVALAARWGELLADLAPRLYAPHGAALPATQLTREFAEPNRAGWSALVRGALAEIDRGRFEKVVCSRRLDLHGPRPFDLGRLLGALHCLFPSCQIISLRRNGSSFVAATPERLLALQGRQVEVDAIAGTGYRAGDPAEDAALALALTHSDKNLREHRVVIDAIRAALAPCCSDLEVPPRPAVLPLRNAHHLWSPIRARVHRDLDLFDLAARLHPTPATNGEPRAAARDWLAGAEPFARGWYTGAAGILAPDLSGELWVLLRCARLCGSRAELYAGAGIVAGSDPDSEWAETEAKLAAMLGALTYA